MNRGAQNDVRVAPNIYKTFNAAGEHIGWRVYVRGIDETTGRSRLQPRRFPPAMQLEELEHYRDSHKLATKKQRIEARRTQLPGERTVREGFRADADTYLKLKTVRAMVAFSDRQREIDFWKKAFKDRPRRSITTQQINEQLQARLNAGYAGASVNKLRAALMSLYTQLDGRGAANPVKDSKVFAEAEEIPRGQDPELLQAILDTIPIYKPAKPDAPKEYNLSRVCLQLMKATGYAPAHIARLELEHFSVADRWYVVPRRKKGRPVKRPSPMVRLRMTSEAKRAFTQLLAAAGEQLKAGTWSGVDRKDLSHTWQRACRRYERQQRARDEHFALPRIRLYDIRHTFGTSLYEATENLGTVAMFLGNTPKTARRYSIGAVPTIAEKAAAKLEGLARRRRAGNKKRR